MTSRLSMLCLVAASSHISLCMPKVNDEEEGRNAAVVLGAVEIQVRVGDQGVLEFTVLL
jgi:hypothetical protein